MSSAQGAVSSISALQALVGERLGPSSWHTIDQPTIDGFAAATGDRQWIHVDPVRAAAGPFAGTIAHGFLTLALCPSILAEVLPATDAAAAVNYGLGRVRFPAPVPVDSRLRGTCEILEYAGISQGAQVVIRIVIEIDGAPKPACVADQLVRFYAREDPAGPQP
jgi:acyl dehydratase